MGRALTRGERRATLREGRKVFEKALKVAQEVEVGLKRVVNDLPLRKRLGIALRILGGIWR